MQDNILKRIHSEGSPVQLAIFRIIIASYVFWIVQSQVFILLQAIDINEFGKTIFPNYVDELISVHLVRHLILICKVSAIFVVLGLFSKLATIALSITFLILYSYFYRGVGSHAHWLHLWFPLFILAFSKCGDVLSLDAFFGRQKINPELQTYRWPLELVGLWFIYIYTAAGFAKLLPLSNGLVWINGITAKKIVYFRFLESPLFHFFEKPLFNIAKMDWLFQVGSTAVLILELSTLLLLFFGRQKIWIVPSILVMHIVFYLVGITGFFVPAAILAISFISPKRFQDFRA